MASRGKQAEPRRPAPRLYLVTPQEPAGLADRLAEALAAADVAAVLLRLPQGQGALCADHARAIAPTGQKKGPALLLHWNAGLAGRAGADAPHPAAVSHLAPPLPALTTT